MRDALTKVIDSHVAALDAWTRRQTEQQRLAAYGVTLTEAVDLALRFAQCGVHPSQADDVLAAWVRRPALDTGSGDDE